MQFANEYSMNFVPKDHIEKIELKSSEMPTLPVADRGLPLDNLVEC